MLILSEQCEIEPTIGQGREPADCQWSTVVVSGDNLPKEDVMGVLKKLGLLVTALIVSVALSSPVCAGQRKYEGVQLRVMLPDGFTEAKAVSDLLLEAGKILGTEVKVSWYSSDELHDKALMDFTGGNKAWDILLVHSPDRGQWAEMGVIDPVGKFIAEHPNVVDKAKLALNDYYEAHIRMYTH
jgi:ABC-type glycerol-3-phosphate transport system substrate-binding protein